MHSILSVYNDTIYEDSDFKSKAFRLTFDFQYELEKLQEALKNESDAIAIEKNDSLNEAFQDVLNEVSENADQLEEGLQNDKAYPTGSDVIMETVLKVEDGEDVDDSVVTLLDHDHNEYILMRPSDTTVIIEGNTK
jgi:hypothetical protein